MGEGRRTLELSLNGRPIQVEIGDSELLLDVVRDRLGLTGAKRSCDLQICGTCTLLVDGAAVSSCTMLAYEVDGRSLETIEGLSGHGELHPLQEAFVEHGALQCGFCTPGMVLAAKALLEEVPDPSPEQVVSYLEGNICRCTGYHKIVEAVLAVGAASASSHKEDHGDG